MSDIMNDSERKAPTIKKRKKRRGGVPLPLVIVLMIATFMVGGIAGRSYFISLSSSSMGISNKKISSKLALLEQCVDNFFLYDVDSEKLESGVYRGFMSALNDPYAAYYTADEYKQLNDEDAGEYKGIGISVSKNSSNNYTEVMEVFKDDPAYKAGVEVGDLITAVNGEDTADMTLTEVVQKIKKSEDPVVLTIFRETEQLEIKVDKSTITIDSVSYEMKENSIGYISVSQFIDNTDENFLAAVDDLQSQGMKGLIIDLRDDGGGLLTTCVNMVSRIIPKGDLIVYTETKSGERNDYNSNSEETLDLPIVILVNGNTASASEIMTGCLKDYSKATIIGTTTYGKGIVQSIIPFSDGSAIKLTVSSYYTPKGVCIHKKGIEPDIKMEMTDEEWKEARNDPSKDEQIKRACEVLVDAQTDK